MKESHREGLATTLAPSHASTEGNDRGEALTGGSAGRIIELRDSPNPGVPTSSNVTEGNSRHADIRKVCAPHGVVELVHARTLSARKLGDPCFDHGDGLHGPSGEPKGYGLDVLNREVRRMHSTGEALEQGWWCAAVCGGGGGKAFDRGEPSSERQRPHTVADHGWDELCEGAMGAEGLVCLARLAPVRLIRGRSPVR